MKTGSISSSAKALLLAALLGVACHGVLAQPDESEADTKAAKSARRSAPAWMANCEVSAGISYTSTFDDVAVDDSDAAGATMKRSRSAAAGCAAPRGQSAALASPQIEFQGGDNSERNVQVVDDPDKPGNKVLRFWMQSPNVRNARNQPVKGRIQMDVYGNRNVTALDVSVRMRLSGGFTTLSEFPKSFSWLTVSEWWNNPSWLGKNGYPFRISVNLEKPSAASGSPLRWGVHAQMIETGGKKAKFTPVWDQIASNVDVPIERWMTVRYSLIEGIGNRGRFRMTVTPDGQPEQVVFDIQDTTHHPDDPHPDGFTHVNPMKLYTSTDVVKFASRGNSALIIDWDDLSMQLPRTR
ncbi:MAG: hypothetical protein ABIO63_11540 [Casimicrobiaceae bacterium]